MRKIMFCLCLFLLSSCGGQPPSTGQDPPAGRCEMLTLPAKFAAENRRQPNAPAFIVKVVKSELKAESTSATDWENNIGAIGVDLATDPGSVLLDKADNTGVIQTSYDSELYIGAGLSVYPSSTVDDDGFGWQSFQHSLGGTAYLKEIKVHIHATGSGSFANQVNIQLFAADKSTPLSTVKSVGGTGFVCDGMIAVDFSEEEIALASGTTYEIKVTCDIMVLGSPSSADIKIRYHSNTATYGGGQMDGKSYSASSESTNIGDMAFIATFNPTYVPQGFIRDLLDLQSTPTVTGEWRIDRLTPSDSGISVKAYALTGPTVLNKSSAGNGTNASWTGAATNGSRIVKVGNGPTTYCQTSDDGGATWDTRTMPSTGNWFKVVWTGKAFVAVKRGSNATAYSYDGATWYSGGSLPASANWGVLEWNGTVILAIVGVGTSSNVAATSADHGLSWQSQTMSATADWRDAAWSGPLSLWCAVAYGGTTAATAPADASTWTGRTLPASANWISVAWGNDIFLAIAYDSTQTGTSTDGSTWSSGSTPYSASWYRVRHNGLIFLATSSSGYDGGYTVDGSSWTMTSSWYLAGHEILPRDAAFLVFGSTPANYHLRPNGYVELGEVSDGTEITALTRYYVFAARLTPDTNLVWSPSLRSVLASFPTWLTVATHTQWGCDASVRNVSSLQTTIDTFKESSVGQVGVSLAFTRQISSWLHSNYPRNKEVRIYTGFAAPGFEQSDFIDYYRGYVEDFAINPDDTVPLKIRDYSKAWKGVPVPASWTTTVDDQPWTAANPVDIMLDILFGFIGVSSRTIDSQSFADVKTALSTWKLTRTITGEPKDAKELLEELRILTSTIFIPGSNGKIKLKRFDPGEAAVANLTDESMMNVKYEGNSASLINLVHVYYNLNPDGTGRGGTIVLGTGYDSVSKENWNELKLKSIRDYWTASAESAQTSDFIDKVIARYAGIPPIVSFDLDRRNIHLEVGDPVNITTKRAPSNDMSGMSSVKFQIFNRNLAMDKDLISFKALRAA